MSQMSLPFVYTHTCRVCRTMFCDLSLFMGHQCISGQAYAPTVTADSQEKIVEAKRRKQRPLARGCLDYFPDALMEVAHCSFVGNEQHHPGGPLHWDKSKSTDEADALLRHLVDRGSFDTDGVRHSAKVAWRALALLQRELDKEKTSKVELK